MENPSNFNTMVIISETGPCPFKAQPQTANDKHQSGNKPLTKPILTKAKQTSLHHSTNMVQLNGHGRCKYINIGFPVSAYYFNSHKCFPNFQTV